MLPLCRAALSTRIKTSSFCVPSLVTRYYRSTCISMPHCNQSRQQPPIDTVTFLLSVHPLCITCVFKTAVSVHCPSSTPYMYAVICASSTTILCVRKSAVGSVRNFLTNCHHHCVFKPSHSQNTKALALKIPKPSCCNASRPSTRNAHTVSCIIHIITSLPNLPSSPPAFIPSAQPIPHAQRSHPHPTRFIYMIWLSASTETTTTSQ